MKRYAGLMSKDQLKILFDQRVADVLRQNGFTLPPERPRSVYKVDKLYDALRAFSPTNSCEPNVDGFLRAGKAFAWKCFAKRAGVDFLHPLPLTLESVDTLTSNPTGSPGLTAYGTQKRYVQSLALQKAERIIRKEAKPEPCIAFKRTQFDDKTRLVWGFPYSMTILEGLIAKPTITKFLRGRTSPMAFGMSTGVLGTKLRVLSHNYRYAYSLDMSQFDAHIAQTLIKFAFRVIMTWFDLNEKICEGQNVGNLFEVVQHYFIHTPLLMPNSQVYWGKRHGVPSGSYFTQLVDSIVNCVYAGAISAKFGLEIRPSNVLVLGDDLIFFSDTRVDLNLISEYAKGSLGVLLHGSEKSNIYQRGETIHYLGRDWPNGVPSLPLQDILQRMVYPEKFRNYPQDKEEADRQVQLLFMSYACVYEPAIRIFEQCYGSRDHRFREDEILYEFLTKVVVSDETPECHLSGYDRYKSIYLTSGDKRNNGITSVGMQFWL